MGRFICHHEGQFFEWSTVCDGPVTYAMTREEFEAYYRDEYGRRAFEDELPARMERALAKGTSSREDDSLRDLVRFNRAGPRDGTVSFKRIIEMIQPPCKACEGEGTVCDGPGEDGITIPCPVCTEGKT